MNTKLAVFTAQNSDFLELLQLQPVEVSVFAPDACPDLSGFDAIALLGGVSAQPLLLRARTRNAVEAQLRQGKKVFAEYVGSIGHVYCDSPVSTRFERLAVCTDGEVDGLEAGDLIDEQCNMRLRPYSIACSHERPILQYVKVHAHDKVEMTAERTSNISDRGLWLDNPKHLMICSFRLANFAKARFAPRDSAMRLIAYIAGWLLDCDVDMSHVRCAYTVGSRNPDASFMEQVKASAEKAVQWFEKSGVVYDEGLSGALEGPGTEIDAEGKQRMSAIHRVDCIGEIALPYALHHLLSGDERSLLIADRLCSVVFDEFMCKDKESWYGMIRWTEEAWGVCYQDDVARAVLPQLLRCLYTNSRDRLDDIVTALRFLINTTGTDGTRVYRTDNIKLTPQKMEQLRTTPGNMPSAHYNAYYYAALLLFGIQLAEGWKRSCPNIRTRDASKAKHKSIAV